jgi:uncharacterized pyridoxamine 5'-phosphate oxidase family protein
MNSSNSIKEEALTYLKKNNTAVIATIWKGEPHASTVHYIVDDDFNMYFLSHRNTSKYLNISSHQRAAVVVGTGPKHIGVQTKGIVDMVLGKERDKVFGLFHDLKESRSINHWPIEEMKIFEDKSPVAFKFEPLELTFLNLDDDAYPHSKGKNYHQLMSQPHNSPKDSEE